jgi:hypothetical protein
MANWTEVLKSHLLKFGVGRAVDTASLPSYSTDDIAPIVLDKTTGELLVKALSTITVNQADLIRTVDSVSVAHATDVIMENLTALTPKFAVIDAAGSGDNTIIAAVASKKIRVLSCFLVSAGAVSVRFESGAAGTALTGQMNVAANGGFSLPYNPVGWFQTAAGVLLNMELGSAVSVDGCLTYVEAS